MKTIRLIKGIPAVPREDHRSRAEKQLEAAQVVVDPDNPVVLYFGPSIDTTNRSLVYSAQDQRFDPKGFSYNLPLRKDIFYTDPYVTCSNCNLLNFVDVVTIRRMLNMSAVVSTELKLAPEVLPPCSSCGSADCFVIGSHDFSEEVERRRR